MTQDINLANKQDLKFCSVCSLHFHNFNPFHGIRDSLLKQGYKYLIDDFETLNVDELFCPACQATDRERFVAYIIRQNILLKLVEKEKVKVLDMSGTTALGVFLRYHPNILYSSVSKIDADNVDIKSINYENLPFKDGEFDIVLCLHVLESENDDNQVLKEIFRVLKPGARAFIVSPINLSIENTKDIKTTNEPKNEYLMFEKHKRLYSKKDFVSLIKSFHFVVKELRIPKENSIMGLSKTATLYEAVK